MLLEMLLSHLHLHRHPTPGCNPCFHAIRVPNPWSALCPTSVVSYHGDVACPINSSRHLWMI